MNRWVTTLRNAGAVPRALPHLVANARRYLHYSPEARRVLAAFARASLSDCDRVGAMPRAVSRPRVINRGQIFVGDNLFLRGSWGRVTFQTGPEGTLTIGDNVDINYGTLLSAQSRVTIGSRVMIGNCCIVADAEVPSVDGTAGAPPQPIDIGDDVWLAVRVTVLPGAKIGKGAVITAGSLVAGEIPPGVVAGGIPARVIRQTATSVDRERAAASGGVNGISASGANGAAGRGAANGATAHGATAPNGTANATERTNGTHGHAAPANGQMAPAAAPERTIAHRGSIISSFTVDELAEQLHRIAEPPGLAAHVAGFGQVAQALMSPPAEGEADFAVVWTQPEAVIPSFGRVLAGEIVREADLLAEVDGFASMIAAAAQSRRFVFVPTWTHPTYDRGLGLIDWREGGVARSLTAMNLRMMDALAKVANVHVLAAHRWIERAGRNAYSPKPWYLGKVPFHTEVFVEAAKEIHAAIRTLTGQSRKLVIVDLDDTMWGGIVGDVGWENLRLGGHDGHGESFVDFQRSLKALTKRGIILGIVSKNTESVALEAIRKHPEMVLREDDFVGWKINWQDKARNVAELVSELNLGLQSVVFIDDNPVERARVREALPEVFVPEWPEDKLLYKSALLGLRCLDVATISKEDQERTQLYAAERKREQLQQQVGSIDEWLKTLDMTVRAEPLGGHNRQRTAQLLNKTNQMNLSTRRMTEEELVEWARHGNRSLFAISVADKFGDAGLTGIVSVETEGSTAKIVDFVLSCRVMGRKVENALFHLAIEQAAAQGAKQVIAEYIPTKKNAPCLSFLQSSGLSATDDKQFVWDTSNRYPLPEAIRLEKLS